MVDTFRNDLGGNQNRRWPCLHLDTLERHEQKDCKIFGKLTRIELFDGACNGHVQDDFRLWTLDVFVLRKAAESASLPASSATPEPAMWVSSGYSAALIAVARLFWPSTDGISDDCAWKRAFNPIILCEPTESASLPTSSAATKPAKRVCIGGRATLI